MARAPPRSIGPYLSCSENGVGTSCRCAAEEFALYRRTNMPQSSDLWVSQERLYLCPHALLAGCSGAVAERAQLALEFVREAANLAFKLKQI